MTRTAIVLAILLAVAGVAVVAPAAAASPATAGSAQADAVRITGFDAPDEAARGDRIEVTATVENTGDEQADAMVTYRIDGVLRASAARTLAPGETATVTLYPTIQRSLNAGTYDHGVFLGSSDRGQVAPIEIVRTGSPAVTVSEFRGPTGTTPGTTVTASATVENTGAADGTTTLEYRIGGQVVATREVSLLAGTNVTVSFRATVPELSPGTYRQGIFRGNTDEGSTGQLVIDPPSPRFEMLSFHGPPETRSGETVRATATVRNAGTSRVTQVFEYRIGGQVVDAREVTLPSGQAATLEFRGTVPNLAAGTYRQGVFQEGTEVRVTRSIDLVEAAPSFVVTSLRAPSRAAVGAEVSATAVVENTGGTRGTTRVRYRIDGTTVDAETVSIVGGGSQTVTLEGTVPDRSTGIYDQGVFVDDTGRGLTMPLTIQRDDPSPDVRISKLDAPSAADGGDRITVRATVRNAGSRTDRVTVEYRIGSQVIDDARVELRPGRSTTVRFDVAVPDLPDGVYRQGVFVDDTNRGQTSSLRIRPRTRFRVSNFRGPSSARVGDPISVAMRIDNTGDERATGTVEYRIGSRVVAAKEFTLNGGAYRQLTLEGTVPSVAPGTYRQVVSVGDSSWARDIEVRPRARPRATFRISSFDGPSQARVGDPISAGATVRNTGNASGTVTVDHRIGGRILSSQRVTLDPGQQRTLSFDATVPNLETKVHRHGVFVAGTVQGDSTDLLVRPGTPRFSVSNVRAPAAAIPGDRITVEATLTNTGPVAGTTTVQYRLAGERLASTSVELDAGAETAVSFEVTVPDLDPGSYSHGVFVGDTDRGGTTSLTVEATETPTPSPSPSPTPTAAPSPTPSPSPSPTPPETTTTGSPGFGVPAALAALAGLSVGAAALRRRRRR